MGNRLRDVLTNRSQAFVVDVRSGATDMDRWASLCSPRWRTSCGASLATARRPPDGSQWTSPSGPGVDPAVPMLTTLDAALKATRCEAACVPTNYTNVVQERRSGHYIRASGR
jgi:hypothetical protein